MPSYVRPGIRKCAKNRALSNASTRIKTSAGGCIIGIAMSHRRNHSSRSKTTNRINAMR